MAQKDIGPRRFLDPKTIARISPLDLRARHVVEGFISGMHRSPFFGHSIEFVQHREYVPGDDLRHLDWKVWSKTDRYYIKQYEEETNLRSTFVVDVSESMHYGRGPLDKYGYACTVGACLAYLLLHQQDSAGLITFDSDVRQTVPSRSGQLHIDAIVKGLDVSRPRQKTDLEKILRRVAETISSRGMIVLVSDLLADREALFRGLEMLSHRRHDILVFHVLDSDELSFPFAGSTRFEGMEELPSLLCDPRALREGYLQALDEYLIDVRRGCARRGIDYALVRTSDNLDAVLSKFLHHRMAFKSSVKARAKMFELFLNPANVIVGGALVGSPILIHLINRMRYKRIRWAAMEFLLKSQKRNRRRLIIEQLILLALRILLVLLAGLMLARFLGFAWAGFEAKNSLHVVLLDDRLSMADQWRTEDGATKNSFQLGQQLLLQDLGKVLAQARTPQQLVFLRLSEPGRRFESRLNEESLREFGAELTRATKPTLFHLDLARGVDAAREILDKNPQDKRFLHIVSDFRQEHWTEPAASELIKKLESLSRAEVKISLLDTAHPFRSESLRLPLYHDNLAVVELKPETKVVAEQMPVQFTVTVANFSPSERKNVRVTVKVEGSERPEGSLTMLSVPPGHTSATFQVAFVRLGHNEITATLENEEAGLQADNTRYAVVEVRRQVPVLVVDGDPTNGDKPGGDTYHLRTLLTSARGFEVVRGSAADLERPSLQQFPSVYLLNVRELNERALKNLQNYVKDGGSSAFFLGDRVNPDYYTKKLYADGKGIFPVPLAERPSPALSDEEKLQKQNLLDPQYQIFIRNPAHPVFAEVAKHRDFFKFLSIDRYYPVPRQRWNKEAGQIEELVTLPNNRPVTEYQASAQEMLDSFPVDDPQYLKYRPALERHRRAIRDALTGKALYLAANAVDDLLRDTGEANNPDRANLKEFWELPDQKIQALRGRIERFKEMVQFGDPLVVAGRLGRGRTVAFLTTAGRKWNDWAGGGPASVTYPIVMLELQKYLAGADVDDNRTVGRALEIDAESSRYEPRIHCFFQQAGRGEGEAAKPPDQAAPSGRAAGARDLGEQVGSISGSRLSFRFDGANEPGIYSFDLVQHAEGSGESKIETRAYAFNVDTANESDLRRAPRDVLDRLGRVNTPVSGSMADLMERQADLSESAWIYVLMLVVLLAEQALAVRLSFHLRDHAAPQPAMPVGASPAAA